MSKASIDHPGIREQHLLRKQGNPLFDEDQRTISSDDIADARLRDGIEKDRFQEAFNTLVGKAADLEPNAPSETVLEIKEELDQSYQQACALPGDQEPIKSAIRKLVAVIMQAVWNSVGTDAFARQQLQDEEIARNEHFQLQELPLVAALMHPDSPIAENELIPSLLSEPEESLIPTMQIFDENQIAQIYNDAGAFLEQRDPAHMLTDAWRRLQIIEDHYRHQQPVSRAN